MSLLIWFAHFIDSFREDTDSIRLPGLIERVERTPWFPVRKCQRCPVRFSPRGTAGLSSWLICATCRDQDERMKRGAEAQARALRELMAMPIPHSEGSSKEAN